MKKILFFLSILLSVTLVQAYQTKSTPRPNFSSQSAAENAVQTPGQQGVQTRTFSSYGARQGAWRRGVTTDTVKTPSAAESKAQEKDFAPIPQEPAAKPEKKDTKKANSATSSSASHEQSAPTAQATPTAASTQAAVAQAMPTGVMEQLQGLQKMMSGLGGAAGGNPAAGGAAGMPDMSSLLNSMPGTQQPKK